MTKFIHPLTIERVAWDDSARDAAGQPTASTSTTSVMGLVQPRRASELEDYRSAGSQVGDHVIFLPATTDVRSDDAIVQGTRRYAIVGVRRFEFGGLTHLEVDAQLVTPVPVAVGGS
jgi:hypothetical protein